MVMEGAIAWLGVVSSCHCLVLHGHGCLGGRHACICISSCTIHSQSYYNFTILPCSRLRRSSVRVVIFSCDKRCGPHVIASCYVFVVFVLGGGTGKSWVYLCSRLGADVTGPEILRHIFATIQQAQVNKFCGISLLVSARAGKHLSWHVLFIRGPAHVQTHRGFYSTCCCHRY